MPAAANSAPLEALLASIRKRCKSGLWSQGVTLARAGAVAVESQPPRRSCCACGRPGGWWRRRWSSTRRRTSGSATARRASAPASTWRRRRSSLSAKRRERARGAAGASGRRPGRAVGYRFSRARRRAAAGARAASRPDGSEAPLAGTLRARLANPARGGAAAGRGGRSARRPTCWRRRRRRAAACCRREAGRAAADPGRRAARRSSTASRSRSPTRRSCPHATLTDAAGAGGAAEVRLTIAADPRVRAVRQPRASRCARTTGARRCTAWARPSSTGVWLQNLPMRRAVRAPRSWASWSPSCCPIWRGAPRVDMRSNRLPPVVRDLAPRIVLSWIRSRRGLSVLPTLVYGSPPGRAHRRRQAGLPARPGPAARRGRRAARGRAAARRAGSAAGPPHHLRRRRRAPLRRQAEDAGAAISSGDAAGVVKPAATLAPRLRVVGDAAPATQPAVRFELTFEVSRPAGGRQSAGPQRSTPAAVVRAWQEGLGHRAARRRRLGRAAARLAAEARPAGRRSAGRARGRRPPGAPRAAGAGRALRRARAPAAARASIALAPLLERLRAPPRGAAARRSDRHAARLPAAGRRLAAPSCAAPAWAASSPTTWASARRCRRCARSTSASATLVVCPDQRALQLAGRARALPPRR